jgi:hypothetical protein
VTAPDGEWVVHDGKTSLFGYSTLFLTRI